jgi:hypothetical protein
MSYGIATFYGPAIRPHHDSLDGSDLEFLRQNKIPRLGLVSFFRFNPQSQDFGRLLGQPSDFDTRNNF